MKSRKYTKKELDAIQAMGEKEYHENSLRTQENGLYYRIQSLYKQLYGVLTLLDQKQDALDIVKKDSGIIAIDRFIQDFGWLKKHLHQTFAQIESLKGLSQELFAQKEGVFKQFETYIQDLQDLCYTNIAYMLDYQDQFFNQYMLKKDLTYDQIRYLYASLDYYYRLNQNVLQDISCIIEGYRFDRYYVEQDKLDQLSYYVRSQHNKNSQELCMSDNSLESSMRRVENQYFSLEDLLSQFKYQLHGLYEQDNIANDQNLKNVYVNLCEYVINKKNEYVNVLDYLLKKLFAFETITEDQKYQYKERLYDVVHRIDHALNHMIKVGKKKGFNDKDFENILTLL